jgi:ATP-dependent DNA ligase
MALQFNQVGTHCAIKFPHFPLPATGQASERPIAPMAIARFVSKVRNGFVPRLRREVWSRLRGLETSHCPFFNLPEKRRTQWALTREEMKNCIWLKPEMVGQFEFTEWTPDGHLRHSKFCGFREDQNPRDVIREN